MVQHEEPVEQNPGKMKVIDATEFASFSSFFRGKKGIHRAEKIMHRLAIDKVNRVHELYGDHSGTEFTSRLLKDAGVHYQVGNEERLKELPGGAFITVSNHPYGGLDGIMTIDLIGHLRPDYKFMVNQLLGRIAALRENFITVTPTTKDHKGISASSLKGVRETMTHLENGHPVGFFPSGAVSDFRLRSLKIRDRNWQKSILHLIQKAKVPILPLRFFDHNSAFFYFLGLISWRIRLLRLPTEVFNKRDRNLRIGIGNIIPVREQELYTSPELLGTYLRKAVYEMPMPSEFSNPIKVFGT